MLQRRNGCEIRYAPLMVCLFALIGCTSSRLTDARQGKFKAYQASVGDIR
jgi:hypothetical protein